MTSELITLLRDYLSRFASGVFRDEISRKDFLEHYASAMDIDPSQLAIEFESHERQLRGTLFVAGWSVYYNVYTDRIIFERIPDSKVLARMVELKEKNIRRELMGKIAQLDPYQFENFVANLFRSLPWIHSVTTTKRSHDGGVDLKGVYMDPKAGIEIPLLGQVKRWGSRVDFPEMTKFLGVLESSPKKNTIGVFVASSGYTDGAKKAAEGFGRKVVLYDAQALVDLMLQNNVGVRQTTLEAVSPDDEFWSELLP